jgi:hypothetical protein
VWENVVHQSGLLCHFTLTPEMVRPVGLEPTTPRFEAWYSIQLNYGRMITVTAFVNRARMLPRRPFRVKLKRYLRAQ